MRPTLRSRAPSTPTGVSTILRCASSYKGTDSQPDPGRRPWIRSLRRSRHPLQRRAGLIVAFMAPLAAPEAYTLEVRPDRIIAAASDPRGLLYAAVTLWQLCTAGAAEEGRSDAGIEVPALRIV